MGKLSEENKEIVVAILVDKLCVDESEIKDESDLQNDLGADSLDVIDITMEIEKKFDINIHDNMLENVATVGDIYNVLTELL